MNIKAMYILIAFGVLGMTAVGASAYTGRAVASRLSEQAAQISRLMPELRVEEKIKPGPFRTSRDVKFQLGCVLMPGKDGTTVERTAPVEVHWRDTIHHVPFVSAAGKVASIDSELEIAAAGVEQLFGTRTPLTLHTKIAADGGFDSDAKLVAFKVAPKPGDEFEFSGLAMHLTRSASDAAGKFSYAANSEPLQLRGKAEDGSFAATVGAMQVTGNMQIDAAAPSFITPHHSEMRVADLSARVVGPGLDGSEKAVDVALQGVTSKLDNTIANDLLTATTQMQGSLKVDNFAIDKLEMGSTVRNLHVPTLTKLMHAWMGLTFSCEAARTPEALMAQLGEMGKGALELLPHAPEYKVGPLALELGGKRAELSYTLGVHGVAPGSSPELMELAMKYGYASAESRLDLGLIDQVTAYASKLGAPGHQPVRLQQGGPDPVAMMARGMIEGFVQQGFLDREGETVRGKVEFDAGKVKLNGRPFELPDFGGMDLDAMKRTMIAGEPDEHEPEDDPEPSTAEE